jgi:hypothetical protein
MKKVVFKWVTTMIDFESEQEAKDYIKKHYKGIPHFIKSEDYTSNDTFNTGKPVYTVEIQTKYNDKYNAGF